MEEVKEKRDKANDEKYLLDKEDDEKKEGFNGESYDASKEEVSEIDKEGLGSSDETNSENNLESFEENEKENISNSKNEGMGGSQLSEGNQVKEGESPLEEGSLEENAESSKGVVEDTKISNSGDSSETNIDKNDIEKEIHKKQNNMLKWVFFLMIGIIVLVILVPYVKMNYFDRFEYGGLEFQKTQLGELVFYSAKFPVVGLTGNVIGNYAVNLRNDPRDLEYINVNVSEDKIKFAIDDKEFGDVYISLYPFMETCEDTGIAMVTLAGYLRDSGLEVKSAVTDKAYARNNNQTQKWCSPFETVIVISDRGVFTDGNETAITEIGKNCYEIKFKDCEVMQATERFMLIILEEYAGRFGGG